MMSPARHLILQMLTAEWSHMTVILPGDTRMPMPGKQWRRMADGRLLATYTAEEWAVAKQFYDAITVPVVEQGRLGV